MILSLTNYLTSDVAFHSMAASDGTWGGDSGVSHIGLDRLWAITSPLSKEFERQMAGSLLELTKILNLWSLRKNVPTTFGVKVETWRYSVRWVLKAERRSMTGLSRHKKMHQIEGAERGGEGQVLKKKKSVWKKNQREMSVGIMILASTQGRN